ncbi:winged helix-turn-helix domain-containing protein [Dactylosporangium sp. AC04546]|uniref:ArsR/SmtB family transcription factor n=1 Tax=Dactylosporangium sp. AC04546 TaxID=2862460 RepID=UPI0027E20A40|nr:winged helix-turn-helix domain-containing protein [Dactylosporangium sp. AC04546]WVK80199.1 winged helix-turn-helix domain-containing protein [Dactylosporangium sp. AC04546]
MKRLELTAADLLGVRFAHSPMAEVVTSTFALRGTAWPFAAWRERVAGDVARAGLGTFWAVLDPPTGVVPDFLTPVPATPRPRLSEELRRIAATPLARVEAELTAAGVPSHDPAGVLGSLVREIERYHRIAVAPVWPRLRSAAEAEIAARAQLTAARGPRSLLADLHPRLRWDPDALRLDYLKDGDHPPWSLDGHALALLPSGFAGPHAWVMESGAGRALWYPPAAYGALWAAPFPPPAALAGLLGATRAAVLSLLAVPSSTGDVAATLSLAPATASHHLTALRDAGLAVGARTGRRLLYRRTDLGDRLHDLG